MWETFCCCGAVQCCPFSTVAIQISQASLRFLRADPATQQPVVWRYQTQVSPINQTPATLSITTPTIITTHTASRFNVSGPSIPSCAYRRYNPPGSFTWIAGVPWTGGSLVVDPDPTNPFAHPVWTVNSYRWIAFAETYRFNNGATGWEAGLRLEVRDTLWTGGVVHPLGSPQAIVFGRKAGIVSNGCPTNLVYGTGSPTDPSTYRGTIRANPSASPAGQDRIGEVITNQTQYIQYAEQASSFTVSVQ